MAYKWLADLGLGAGLIYSLGKNHELEKKINEIQKKLGNKLVNVDAIIKYKNGVIRALNPSSGEVLVESDEVSSIFDKLLKNSDISRIVFLKGKYRLENPIIVDRSVVSIEGYSYGNDLYFTNDSQYHGISNKYPVVLVADGIDGIKISSNNLLFGIRVKNIAITGIVSEEAMDDSIYSDGAGISILKGQCISIENVHVTRKNFGIYMYAGFTSYDDVIDVVFLRNVMFTYNVYGINQSGWVANLRAHNIFGYINQKSLIKAYPQYDWILENVFSNADAWNSSNVRDAPIYIGTHRHVEIRNVQVFGQKGNTLCPVPLMWFDLDVAGDVEPDVVISRAVLAETQSDAISVDGSGGSLTIRDIRAGYGYMGGNGTIDGLIVKNYSNNVLVKVINGKVRSGQIDPFYGKVLVRRIYAVRNGGEGWSENKGIATISSGSTRVTVQHGLYKKPSIILLTPLGNARIWYENVTDTSFDIVTDTAPSNDLNVAWYAEI